MTFTRNARLIAALLGATILTQGPLLAQTATDASAATETSAATDASAAGDAVDATGFLDEATLDAMTAPIALYPDELLGQVLVATTYPMDVIKADRFLQKNPDLADKDRANAVNKEDWADSVKSLAAGFPELIGRMAEHIDWTEDMGDALIVQTDDVLASIQRLRAQAKVNGYLEDNAAMNVEADADTGNISISSANPEVIYVPQYTDTVYTQPAPATPYYVNDNDNWEDALVTGAIFFGTAMIIDNIFDDDWGNGWDNGYWHGNGGGNSIDWNGDVNIDNGINIGNGNGNHIGNRPGIGNGDRPGIGNGGNLGAGGGLGAGHGNRPGFGDGSGITRPGTVGQDRIDKARDANFRPTDASREAAREKVANRQVSGRPAATLPAATSKGDRGKVATKAADRPAAKPAAKPAMKKPSPAAKPAARPAAKAKAPAVRKPAAHAPAYKPSGGSRARASSARGHASRGGMR